MAAAYHMYSLYFRLLVGIRQGNCWVLPLSSGNGFTVVQRLNTLDDDCRVFLSA
jgi:hypothetical protein